MKKEKPGGIPLETVAIAVISMCIVLILTLIKIYLSNRIYYESRDINTLESEVAALKEENSILKMNVEKLKYKINIIDTVFSLDENQSESTETGVEE